MQIGPWTLPNNVLVAPMAGVTDRPFRQLCKRLGAGYAVSEMAASNPKLWDSVKTSRRLNHDGEIAPVSVQIAGADPAMMAEAAAFNAQRGARIIDINMGCPAKKVCNLASGSALLRQEDLVRRILEAVVARTGDQNPIGSVLLDHVDRALCRHLRLRIQREPGPIAVFEDLLDRVLFGVIDDDAAGREIGIAAQHVDRHARALVLVLEMRRVNQDELAKLRRELDLLGVGRDLVARDAVHADLADAEHRRALEILRNPTQHLDRDLPIVRLLRVHADPRVVLHAVLRRALRLELGQLLEVVLEAVGRAAIPPGPPAQI